jgi:hypothetical protein
MRKLIAIVGLIALVGVVAIAAAAQAGHGSKRDKPSTGGCGKDRRGEPGYATAYPRGVAAAAAASRSRCCGPLTAM